VKIITVSFASLTSFMETIVLFRFKIHFRKDAEVTLTLL